jgi:hypothetical protein
MHIDRQMDRPNKLNSHSVGLHMLLKCAWISHELDNPFTDNQEYNAYNFVLVLFEFQFL